MANRQNAQAFAKDKMSQPEEVSQIGNDDQSDIVQAKTFNDLHRKVSQLMIKEAIESD